MHTFFIAGKRSKSSKTETPPSGENGDSTFMLQISQRTSNCPRRGQFPHLKETCPYGIIQSVAGRMDVFLGVWDKWIDNCYETRENFFSKNIPFYPMRAIIFNIIY